MYKFEVYPDKAGECRFRFRASNGEIMFSCQGCAAKVSALKSIEALKQNVPRATIEDQTTATA